MSERDERIQAYVMNTSCDDWEDLTMILREVGRDAASADMMIAVHEVVQGFGELIRSGCIQANLLSSRAESRLLSSVPAPIEYGDDWIYFLITDKGKELHSRAPEEWFGR